MHSCTNSAKSRRSARMMLLITFAVTLSALSAAAAKTTPATATTSASSSRRQPTPTLSDSADLPSSTTTQGSVRSSPGAIASKHQLFRRVPLDIISTDTLWQQPPPLPSSAWINPPPPSPRPRPPPATTTSDEKPFPLRPTNGNGPPPPDDLSPVNHGNELPGQPNKHGIDLSKLEPDVPKGKQPSDPTPTSRFGPGNDIGILNTPDFINIWSSGNIPPQPGTPIPDGPPIPSPPPESNRPPTPTIQPGGGGGSLPDLPLAPRAATATPTFNAIPIIPPVLSSLNPVINNATAAREPPAIPVCGDAWCSVTETCESCPKDCSVSHFDKFGYSRQLEQAKSPLFPPSHDPQFLTFSCAAPQFAQFCPWPPNSTVTGKSRKQSAMLAIIGSHPSQHTSRLPELLSSVPASAVAVFLDMQLLTSPTADAVTMRKSIHLLRSAGYHLGLAIGSTSMPTSTALSLPSILRAHQVYAHLAAWLARADLGPTTLATYIAASREFAPALPADWPPLVLTTDPNSAYFQALSPAIAQLLHALSTRIVLPSVPVYDHVNKDKQLKGLEIAVDSLKQTMRLWPGVPGWILGLDASSPEGDEIVRRVVGEVAARAEWVSGGVSACFEYFGVPEDKKADKRSVREVVEVVRRRARPAMPEQGWKAELEVESVGRQVKEVSDDGADGW